MFTIGSVTVASVIGAGLFFGLIALAWLVNRHSESREERWLDDSWAEIISSLRGPAEWDGMTFDLPEQDAYGWFGPEDVPEGEERVYQFGAYAGPDTGIDQEQLGVDVEAYIARMEADTTQFIAQIHAMA